jgi:hypothetical protein
MVGDDFDAKALQVALDTVQNQLESTQAAQNGNFVGQMVHLRVQLVALVETHVNEPQKLSEEWQTKILAAY